MAGEVTLLENFIIILYLDSFVDCSFLKIVNFKKCKFLFFRNFFFFHSKI